MKLINFSYAIGLFLLAGSTAATKVGEDEVLSISATTVRDDDKQKRFLRSGRKLSAVNTNTVDSDGKAYVLSFTHSDYGQERLYLMVDPTHSNMEYPVLRKAVTLGEWHRNYVHWEFVPMSYTNTNYYENAFVIRNVRENNLCLEFDEVPYDIDGSGSTLIGFSQVTLQPCVRTNPRQLFFGSLSGSSTIEFVNVLTGQTLGMHSTHLDNSYNDDMDLRPEAQPPITELAVNFQEQHQMQQTVNANYITLGSGNALCSEHCPKLRGFTSSVSNPKFYFLGFYGPTTLSYLQYNASNVVLDNGKPDIAGAVGEVFPATRQKFPFAALVNGDFHWELDWTGSYYREACETDDGEDCSFSSKQVLLRNLGSNKCLEVDRHNPNRYVHLIFADCEDYENGEYNPYQRFYIEPDESTDLDDSSTWNIFKNEQTQKYIKTGSCTHSGNLEDNSITTASPWLSCGQQGRRGLQTMNTPHIWDGYVTSSA